MRLRALLFLEFILDNIAFSRFHSDFRAFLIPLGTTAISLSTNKIAYLRIFVRAFGDNLEIINHYLLAYLIEHL